MEHLETLVDQLAGFGSTTTSVVYSQTLPYRAPTGPDAGPQGRTIWPGRRSAGRSA